MAALSGEMKQNRRRTAKLWFVLAVIFVVPGMARGGPEGEKNSFSPEREATRFRAAKYLASKILVFSKTAGWRHSSIPAGITAIRQLGTANGFEVHSTEDATTFTDTNLARYRAVVFLNTTGNVLTDVQQRAFESYIRAGHGFVGVHAAADTELSNWPWYRELVGAYFVSHPQVQMATIRVENRSHPSTARLPILWVRTDEWYNYDRNPRSRVQVLMTVDESTYTGGAMAPDHPIAWYREYDGGRAWYTGLDHTDATYSEPLFRSHLLGGIQWAAAVSTTSAVRWRSYE